ncbi:retrovirus-related pol polyprotein from transposon TNT 1-94 [Tanacetum coccineum]
MQVVQIILRYLDSGCSKLDLEEGMAPVRIISGPEPKMNGSFQASVFIVKRRLINLRSNLVSQMSQRRLLASLQAPFLKDKKVVKWINVDQLIGKKNLLLDLQKLQKNPIFRISVDIRQNTNYVRAFTTSANIGKKNLLLDLQKLQKNPIFRISVDIRQNTNYVRAFTTSANVPSIYIQLFWNTLTHDAKTGVYSFQVDEHWLTLSDDLLRKALNVTPADSAHPFESPPAGKMDITFTRRRVPSNQPAHEPHMDDLCVQSYTRMNSTGPSVHPEDATSTKMVRETLFMQILSQGVAARPTIRRHPQSTQVTLIPQLTWCGEPGSATVNIMGFTIKGSLVSQLKDLKGDQDNPTHVYRLKKALYGLKQAPRAWYDTLSKFLLANNFFKGAVDPTYTNVGSIEKLDGVLLGNSVDDSI